MTTKGQFYPTRIARQFQGESGQTALDQLRTVDKTRLVKQLGQISDQERQVPVSVLGEMFAG